MSVIMTLSFSHTLILIHGSTPALLMNAELKEDHIEAMNQVAQ